MTGEGGYLWYRLSGSVGNRSARTAPRVERVRCDGVRFKGEQISQLDVVSKKNLTCGGRVRANQLLLSAGPPALFFVHFETAGTAPKIQESKKIIK